MRTINTALLSALVSASLAGQATHAIPDVEGAEFKRPKRRRWTKLDAPHNYPPNPFESRQVKRARERQEKKQRKNTN